MIGQAGDSDTNAAIVGGVVGAVLGVSKLPKMYLEKQFLLELDGAESANSFRGEFY